MTIKQTGGIFGRNVTLNDVEAETVEATTKVTTPKITNGVTSGTLTIGAGAAHNTGANILMYGEGHAQVSDFLFRAGTTQLVRMQDSGEVKIINGNVRFDTAGTGIDFSATSGTGTSELFDDYEEGEWTPVVADASSGGNTGGGTLKGYYTKVGRTVFLVFSGANITTSGMTSGNDLFITGLPYTPATAVGTNYYTGALVMHTVTTSGNAAAAIQDAQNYIKLYETVSGAGFDFITVGDISTGVSDIRFSLTYEAA
jgi:hypothetical protein